MKRFFLTCFFGLALSSCAFGQSPNWWRTSGCDGELVQTGTKTVKQLQTVYDEEIRQRQVTRYVPKTFTEDYTVRVPRTVEVDVQVPTYARRIIEWMPVERLVEVDCVPSVPVRTVRTSSSCARSAPTRTRARTTSDRPFRNWQRQWASDDGTRRNIQMGMINMYTVDASDDDEVLEDNDSGSTFRRRAVARFRARR